MTTATAYAPGRAELLGNHTDYNEGFVMSIAVDKGTTVSGQSRADDKIILSTGQFAHPFQTDLENIKPQDGENSWVNYPLGVVDELLKRGLRLGGFEMSISSNLPLGAGLSSSAALEVSTALFLQKLFGFPMDRLDIAKVCQAAENNFVGVKCGLLDQISSLYGKKDHAIFIDCRSLEIDNIPLSTDTCFVIAHSNVKHSLVAGEYNERRASCEAAAAELGVKALRDADRLLLENKLPDKGSLAYKRAMHVVGENERVIASISKLREGQITPLGEAMFASHASSIKYFENSCMELDILVDLARKLPGCLGARLSGGGFGGATINLVEKKSAASFISNLHDQYKAATGIEPLVFECTAANGAH